MPSTTSQDAGSYQDPLKDVISGYTQMFFAALPLFENFCHQNDKPVLKHLILLNIIQ